MVIKAFGVTTNDPEKIHGLKSRQSTEATRHLLDIFKVQFSLEKLSSYILIGFANTPAKKIELAEKKNNSLSHFAERFLIRN